MFTWIIGMLGTLAFAYACVPTAWATWKAGRSIGTPVILAWNILIACILFYAYFLLAHGLDWLVIICGLIEIAAYGVVIWYHYFPKGIAT